MLNVTAAFPVSSTALDNLAASAVSFTMAGNTGVLPFLSLFIIGIIERSNPAILNMAGWTEALLSSWIGISFFGFMSVLEFISMCIPVVDEVIDSIMTFVIPVMSVIASISTFGIYGAANTAVGYAATAAATKLGVQNATHVGNVVASHVTGAVASHLNTTAGAAGGGGARQLSVASHTMLGFQIFIACVGVGLALSLHFFKMVVRLIGEGWFTPCLTVIEVIWCVSTVFIVIFIRPLAILVAITAIICAVVGVYYFIKRKIYKLSARQRQQVREKQEGQALLAGETQDTYGTDDKMGGWGALSI